MSRRCRLRGTSPSSVWEQESAWRCVLALVVDGRCVGSLSMRGALASDARVSVLSKMGEKLNGM